MVLNVVRSTPTELLVYPEFFDNASLLLDGGTDLYLRELEKLGDRVLIAVWPDYCYSFYPLHIVRSDYIWVYPLHLLKEIDFVLRLSDRVTLYLGYLSIHYKKILRDYSLEQFLEIAKLYGLPIWLMGAKARDLPYICIFDGFDTTLFHRSSIEVRELSRSFVGKERVHTIRGAAM